MAVLDQVLQRASFAAVVVDSNSVIREWNAGAEKLFGFTAAEAVGKNLSVLLGGKGFVLCKDGKRIYCSWQEEKLDDGGVLAIVSDVTDFKTRERLLEVILDNLEVVVWQVDVKGVFTFHDGRKGLERVGLEPGQMLGQNVFALFSESGSDVVTGALAGRPTIDVNEAYGRTWQSWTLPLYDENKTVDGVVGITLDVSESRSRELELREKLEVIQAQQETIRDLSIPLIETWDGVLTVPMVGVVDPDRAGEVMEKLLTEITKRKSRFAIVDLTGVEEVDMNTATHIISLARSIKLLGAEGIVTGIRPTMAQAMVQLGADLTGIRTLGSLRDALGYCIARLRADASS